MILTDVVGCTPKSVLDDEGDDAVVSEGTDDRAFVVSRDMTLNAEEFVGF
jgi:hypothetical protein